MKDVLRAAAALVAIMAGIRFGGDIYRRIKKGTVATTTAS